MNIDSISKLIESADVSYFRTLSAIFLDLIGLPSSGYCDGPYDGGKDFYIYNDKIKDLKIAIQLSVEKDWRKKIEGDALKTKNNFDTKILYFLSSRRIPERSFQDHCKEILMKHGVSVIRYDNQAIASEFIKKNKVSELLSIFGILQTLDDQRIKYHYGAKNEAISSLLIFGEDTKNFREQLFNSIIKSSIAEGNGIDQPQLVNNIIDNFKLSDNQSSKLNSAIIKLFQQKIIIKKNDLIYLNDDELEKHNGLISASRFEIFTLTENVNKYFKDSNIDIETNIQKIIIENILELSNLLVSQNFNFNNTVPKENELFKTINDTLESKVGEFDTKKIFNELAKIVSDSKFAQHLAAAELFQALINTNSSQLIEALGGSESLNIYIDSSVAIPMICGLLFEPQKGRFGHSSHLLYNLIEEHQFNAIIPNVYIEEAAAHLIDACRNYKEILKLGEDLSYSGNAFVSHYSNLVQSSHAEHLTFEDYVNVFGVKLESIKFDMTDTQFYHIRDKIISEISLIISKYNFSIVNVQEKYIQKTIDIITEKLLTQNISRPDILIKHDACVIQYLSGTKVSAGYSKILCTWDRTHNMINSDGSYGYNVLNPIAVIDFFAIAKSNSFEIPMTHLIDFSMMQDEKTLSLSSLIWDEITSIEKENLSDAQLMLKAKSFKESFMENESNNESIESEQVAKAWLHWKNNG